MLGVISILCAPAGTPAPLLLDRYLRSLELAPLFCELEVSRKGGDPVQNWPPDGGRYRLWSKGKTYRVELRDPDCGKGWRPAVTVISNGRRRLSIDHQSSYSFDEWAEPPGVGRSDLSLSGFVPLLAPTGAALNAFGHPGDWMEITRAALADADTVTLYRGKPSDRSYMW